MVALVGDAELDEGNIYEALLEGWKHGLRNTWWIIDYNRQSLDAVLSDLMTPKLRVAVPQLRLEGRHLKYGKLLEAPSRSRAASASWSWIDDLPNALYSALAFEGGWRLAKRLEDDLGDQGALKLIEAERRRARRADDQSRRPLTWRRCSRPSRRARRPAHLLHLLHGQGQGLPFAGHKDNHAGLMTPDADGKFKAANNILDGQEWEGSPASTAPSPSSRAAVRRAVQRAGPRRLTRQIAIARAACPCPRSAAPCRPSRASARSSTRSRDRQARRAHRHHLARRHRLDQPRAWVNRRGIFARHEVEDVFQARKLMSVQRWDMGPKGQHIELGIAEMNLFILLSALGLSHELFGERLIPIGTLYDPFIARGLDALNYACYQEARFILVATPSGITLAPEGGAHQSIGSPLIGMAQDGLAASSRPSSTNSR
jgi:pyruvate dehydrogenase E1 component